MSDPTGKLTQMAGALAEGNFSQEFRLHFSGELGQLAYFLDNLQQNLKTLSPAIGSSAHLFPQVAQAVADISQQTERTTSSMLGLMEEMLADQDRLAELLKGAKENDTKAVDVWQIEKIAEKSRDDLIQLTSYLSFQDVVRQRAAKVQKIIDIVESKITALQTQFSVDLHRQSNSVEDGLVLSQEEANEFSGDTEVDQNLVDDLFENSK